MDIIGCMNAVNKVGKYLILALFAINLVSMSFAQSASSSLGTALQDLCHMSQMFLGAAIMVLIVLAGATYAIGQVLGAETRARATVWATAMMTGALIGAIIYLITPIIIRALLPNLSQISGTTTDPCAFTTTTT
ncbi:MAG: hypothetical protein PHV13_03910 [Candidatus ainarchaeum sp.]|nr:hypothetical protein [Candidatus ainarchaeum sp.]